MNAKRDSVNAILLLCVAVFLCRCASTNSEQPTLKQTDINVSWSMTHYRSKAAFGALTRAEKQRVDKAYSAYEPAFNQAIQAAGGNYNTPTPDNVKQLANQVINTTAAIP